MRNLSKCMWIPLLAALCLSSAQARQQAPPTPPTAPVPPVGGQSSGQEPASPVATPSPTVTGGFGPSAGESGSSTSQIAAGFYANEQAYSNFQDSSTSPGWEAVTGFGGHLNLQQKRANSNLTVNYSGGVQIDPGHSQYDNFFNQFEVNQTIQFRRWILSLDDLFGYFPESPFGFTGNGVAGSSILGTTIIDPSVPPNQTILTPYAERLTNTALAQVQAEISARTNLTFTVSDGILHYFQTGYTDSDNYAFGVGYNYVLNARDTIGTSYQAGVSEFNVVGTPMSNSSFTSNTVLVTYGHRITGRLALQAGAGPQFTSFGVAGNPASISRISWSANAGANYQRNQTSFSASFFRGVASGGGILAGVTTNSFSFSAGRQVGRFWSVNASAGYALNEAIGQVSSSTGNYSSFFMGVGISRNLSRDTSLSANYSFQRQTTSNVVCTESVCAGQFDRQGISINFGWNLRPIPLR